MAADGQRSRQQDAKNGRRRGNGKRRGRWPGRRAKRSLPASRQRALDRIEQTLVAEDPGLGLRFAVFTRLTRDDAMPGTEQVSGRLQRLVRPAIMVPLTVINLVALLTVGWLLPSRQGVLPRS